MTAVEWLVDQIKGGLGITSVMVGLAKEMEKEQKQSEYNRGFDDGYQRKQQELDYLRGKNHTCQDNFKNEPKPQ